MNESIENFGICKTALDRLNDVKYFYGISTEEYYDEYMMLLKKEHRNKSINIIIAAIENNI